MSKHTSLFSRLPKMIDGCTITLPPNASVILAGQSTPQPVIVQALEGFLAPEKKVQDTKLAHDQALKDRDAQSPNLAAYLDKLAAGLKAYYGADSPTLGKFGVPIKRVPAKLTADQLAAKAAKARATREARGTKGKRQKKTIHGVVPAQSPPANGVGNGSGGKA